MRWSFWLIRTAPGGTRLPSTRASPSCAQALQRRPPGRFALMAAIAAVHAQAPSWDATDWHEIVGLYVVLMQIWPSPVVALNHAVAVGLAEGPQAGLDALDAIGTDPLLATYSYLASARADFLRKLGRTGEARAGVRRGAPPERERGRTGIPGGADRQHRELRSAVRPGGTAPVRMGTRRVGTMFVPASPGTDVLRGGMRPHLFG